MAYLAGLAELVEDLTYVAEQGTKFKGIYDMGKAAVSSIYSVGSELKSDFDSLVHWVKQDASAPMTLPGPTGIKRKRAGSFPGPGPSRGTPGRRYITRGTFAGPFSAPRHRVRLTQFDKRGVTTIHEERGTVNSATTHYIMHSTWVSQPLYQAVAMGLYRACLAQVGVNFTDFAALPAVTVTININYRDETGNLGFVSHSVTGLASHQTHAIDLFDKMLAVYTKETIQFYTLDIREGSNQEVQADIQAMSLKLFTVSMLQVQNITEAAAGITDKHDVRNNPLMVKTASLRDSFAKIPHHLQSSATPHRIVDNWGLKTGVGGTHLFADNAFSNVKKVSSCTLGPGVIKTSSIAMKRKVNFNGFLRMTRAFTIPSATTTATTPPMKFGPTRMYEFEKMLHQTGDSDVRVDWQCQIATGAVVTIPRRPSCKRVDL